MPTNCLQKLKNNSDIPLSNEIDWLDDFHNTLDRVDAKELRDVSSVAELALHMSLHGFSREDKDISEGDIWYALVTWLQHLCTRSSMMKIDVNSAYGAGWRVLKDNGGHLSKEQVSKLVYEITLDTYAKKDAGTSMIFRCIDEFVEVDQESKDRVFEFLARMKGSSSELDAFAEAFSKHLTKSLIPKDDIPEI